MKTYALRFGLVFSLCAPLVAALMLAGAVASGPAAASCIDYSQYVHWEGTLNPYPSYGSTVDVALCGTKAFIATSDYSNSRLRVIDISNPRRLREIGSVGVPETEMYSVAVVDCGTVLVGAGTSLYVIDVSYPQTPVIIGSAAIPAGYPLDVAAYGYWEYAIVVTNSSRLYVYSLWDPSAPGLVGSVSLAGSPFSLAVANGNAYVTEFMDYSHGTMQIIGLGDPANPSVLGSVTTPTNPTDVAVAGIYAYVCSGGITIVNVANPRSPYIAGGVPGVDTASCIGISGTKAFTGGSETWCVDITDPLHAHAWRGIALPYYARRVVLSGTLAYVAVGGYGLYVVDASHNSPAPIAGSVNGSLSGSVAVQDAFAYVAAGTSFMTIDVTDPHALRVLGSTNLPNSAHDVAVSGTHAYVVENEYPNFGQLQVIDVSDPARPTIVGAWTAEGYGMAVAVVWPYAYVADYTGVDVIDVTVPENPVRVGHVGLANHAYDVDVSGSRAYVALSTYGLQVVDISDPLNPRIVGDRFLYGGDRVAVMGSYVCLINSGGLNILDGSGGYSVRGKLAAANGGCVVCEEDRAYVASHGIQIVDASDVTQPVFAGTAYASSGAGFAISDSYIYEGASGMLRVWNKPCWPADVTQPGADAAPVATLQLRICPNPAPAGTEIRFTLAAAGAAEVSIYDIAGRLLRTLHDGVIGAGSHALVWDGCDGSSRAVPPGTYLARVATDGGAAESRRVLVLK